MTQHAAHNASRPSASTSRTPIWAIVCIPVVVVAALLFVVLFPWPCTAAVNGTDVKSTVHTTVQDLIESQNLNIVPGDLVAVDGSVIKQGGGEPMHITVNGEDLQDTGRLVCEGDVILVENGSNTTEPFVEEVQEIAPSVRFEGTGAMHRYAGVGSPGEQVIRTGNMSGIRVEETTKEPVQEVVRNFNIDTGGQKVVALTFDDGPWNAWSSEVLDILAANGAKATFFTVGDRIASQEDVVRAAAAAGHQICTHSWDHAAGDGHGVDLGRMKPEDRVSEITKGFDEIARVTGSQASSIIRVPGGNFNEETASVLQPYITAEVGWNIDTRDWQKPGAASIAQRILSVQPGYIVLMHDGGGDRSQTVAALRDALPQLAAQGYRFVTIDELLACATNDVVQASGEDTQVNNEANIEGAADGSA
ncbi:MULTISPECIES: polysaccharide deacetylase family protein [unclassified Adlercreutzia]|uniref:polysaccharide deacetylase family protein n=1 Tax=unclassified Adlercreutzia TaxID=2636013 RepID=UPI001F149FBE|nr:MULTISPECIES: polysaccharide deacetylase family protein [unclassified Adlercreutzia]